MKLLTIEDEQKTGSYLRRSSHASWSLVRRLTAWHACSVCTVALVSGVLFCRNLFYQGLLTVVAGGVLLIYVGNRMIRRRLQPLQGVAEIMQRTGVSTLCEQVRFEGLPVELAGVAESFNNMLGRLDECCSRLSRFSADIAHELRAPISNLRLEAEEALTHPRSAEYYRAVLVSSVEECVHLSRVIDTLLFIAKAEMTQTPIQCEPIDVTEELRTVREFYEPMAEEKSIDINVEPAPQVRAELDRTLFRRAVGNLISNAITYTPCGGTVSIGASQKNGTIRVEVADTGKGIPPEHLPHVFDRFYQVERTHAGNSGGAGLGLSIVKVIMDLHQGSAEIESQPGCGTRVALFFPRNPHS